MSWAPRERYRVVHETHYDYSSQVSGSLHLLHLSPRSTPWQSVESHGLMVTPEATDIRHHEDYFGNPVTRLAIDVPHRELLLRTESQVSITPRAPAPTTESPRLAEMRERLAGSDPATRFALAQYLGPSPLVPLLADAVSYARPYLAPEVPWLRALMALTLAIHDDFDFDPTATTVTTPVGEALARRRGVCQDFAHVLTSCLRSSGLPARYVSGYVLTTPPAGDTRLIGADASHAWVSSWCPGLGWVDLDPTNAKLADTEFVTLGWGRDFADVTPTRGTVLGGGDQKLRVRVTMLPVAGPDGGAGAR
jgi:transglutaminase-like putative cysteine protease